MSCNTSYKIIPNQIIGSGAHGSIYLTMKDKKKKYVTKNPVNKKEAEISKIMSGTIGPKIYDLYECKTYNDTKNITSNGEKIKEKGRFMVMEKLSGLDLNDYLQEEDIFINDDDKLISLLMNKISKLHKKGFHHNDLTTSNIFIIYDKINKIKDIKIIDFGETKKITKEGELDDYNTLLDSINTFGVHVMDKIEPLVFEIEDKIEEIKNSRKKNKKNKKKQKKKVKKKVIKKKLKKEIAQKKKITKELTKENIDKYMKQITLLKYQSKYIKKIEKMTEIVINEGEDICRETISQEYIEDMFMNYDDLDGYLVRYKRKTIGFIFFEINEEKKYMELILVCTKKPKELKVPIGQILIYKMEEHAKKNNIFQLRAHAVPDALKFYKKNKWDVVKFEKEDETYLIEKYIGEPGLLTQVYKYLWG